MTISKSNLINTIQTKFYDSKEIQYNIYIIIEKECKESIEELEEGQIRINFSKLNDKTVRMIDTYIKSISKTLKENEDYEKERNLILKNDNQLNIIKETAKEKEQISNKNNNVDIIEHIKESHYKRYKTPLKIKLTEENCLDEYNKYIKKNFSMYKKFDKYFKRKNKSKGFSQMCYNGRTANIQVEDESIDTDYNLDEYNDENDEYINDENIEDYQELDELNDNLLEDFEEDLEEVEVELELELEDENENNLLEDDEIEEEVQLNLVSEDLIETLKKLEIEETNSKKKKKKFIELFGDSDSSDSDSMEID